MIEIFEWKRLFLNDLPAIFLLEVVFRSLTMFLFLLIALRVLGKRGVKQLSVFELVIIIALGSAAGDPMFYEDVGILPALAVFATIVASYSFVTWLVGKSKAFEYLVEGKAVCLIQDGKFSTENFRKEGLAEDEFFAELRLKSIEHIGQVRMAIIETSGSISVYYYSAEETVPGLPIVPKLFNARSRQVGEKGLYACTFCACTSMLDSGMHICANCGKDEWVKAIATKRIA